MKFGNAGVVNISGKIDSVSVTGVSAQVVLTSRSDGCYAGYFVFYMTNRVFKDGIFYRRYEIYAIDENDDGLIDMVEIF
jgi:hypothetical protein